MAKYIVKLEDGVWLADGDGDPPRTIVRDSAKRFDTFEDAAMALGAAKRIRPFRNAEIESTSPRSSTETLIAATEILAMREAAERLAELAEAERKSAITLASLRELSRQWKEGADGGARDPWVFINDLDRILEET